MSVLGEYYQIYHLDWLSNEDEESLKPIMTHWNEKAIKFTPSFHTQEYFDQMKRRLFEKDEEHYKQWSHLGKSDINWYWSHEKQEFIKYKNGKRI